jgi:hypothetical protein
MTRARFNDQLAIVFGQMLPVLSAAGLPYWVHGGVGVAAVVGHFFRDNRDVDIYVRRHDFDDACRLLSEISCKHASWALTKAKPLRSKHANPLDEGRPKAEVFVDGSERLSVVPVYETEQGVEFRPETVEILPADALVQVPRQLGEYRFFSASDAVIRAMLVSLIQERLSRGKDPRRRRWKDLEHLFTEAERASLGFRR